MLFLGSVLKKDAINMYIRYLHQNLAECGVGHQVPSTSVPVEHIRVCLSNTSLWASDVTCDIQDLPISTQPDMIRSLV